MTKTAILILNWNGGNDTVDCLISLQPALTSNDFIFIIDNGSTDDSPTIIKNFLQKNVPAFIASDGNSVLQDFDEKVYYYYIQNKSNLGFGSGNNVILKQLSKIDRDFEYIWLLNNDAIVEKETLSHLKIKLASNEKLGAAGSIVLNHPDKFTIQNTGVKYYPLLGISKLINKNQNLASINLSENIKFDYINGASLILKTEALNQIGYFDERFFLYSEEFDLQLRLKAAGYQLAVVPESKVYHKLMGSTRDASHLFFYYYCMSSILLTKKHYSIFTLIISTINLLAVTGIRTFPSAKNFYWAFKGILTGLR